MLEADPRRELYLKVGAIVVLVFAVSLLHYGTQTSKPLLHDVYRRLYYIPVGLAAVWFGIRGGLLVSAAVALVYVPHIVLFWNDMGRELANRIMEVGLFFLFAGATGYFADRERKFRRRWQSAAEDLERSYRQLRRQTDVLLETEEQLRRADRLSAVGQLAAGMTHEIRNPLGSIKGTAEILRDEFPTDHPKAEFLDILLRETDRLNRVVEDFLGYARSEERNGDDREVDLAAVVRETASLVEAQARRAGVVLELRLPKELNVHRQRGHGPTVFVALTLELADGLRVRGPPDQLRQVILNLLLNAVQATPEGRRVVVRTEVRSGAVTAAEYREMEGPIAALMVEDEGPGISPENLPRVFDPFFTTKPGGTGLGLAISRRIAQTHGWQLTAANRPDGGALFTLSLPVTEPHDASEEADVQGPGR